MSLQICCYSYTRQRLPDCDQLFHGSHVLHVLHCPKQLYGCAGAGAALLGIGAVSWYMYSNQTLPGTMLQMFIMPT